jgi:hypothetical protein
MKGVAPSGDTELIVGIKSLLLDFDAEQSEPAAVDQQRSTLLTSEPRLHTRIATSEIVDEPKKDSDSYSGSDDSSLSSSSSDDSSVSSQRDRPNSNMLKVKQSEGGRSTSIAEPGDSSLSSESSSVSSSSDESSVFDH